MKDLELQSQEQLQVVKKEWISPEMEEINVNGGIIGGIYERSTTMGQRGMLS